MNYKIDCEYFDPDGRIEIWFYAPKHDCILIDASVADFEKFMPDVEGEYQDGNGKYTARFDKNGNLHWLFSHGTFVDYKVVNCNQVIDELIYAHIQKRD